MTRKWSPLAIRQIWGGVDRIIDSIKFSEMATHPRHISLKRRKLQTFSMG